MKKLILAAIFFSASLAHGQEVGKRESLNDPEGKVVYSTNIDFDSTLIEGQMKAPQGFFLQGRNKQSLSNMVKLRSSFKQELRNSRTAVKAMVK